MNRRTLTFTAFAVLLAMLFSFMIGCGPADEAAENGNGEGEEVEEPAAGEDPTEDEIESVEVLGDLQIGDRVMDPSWTWEFRLGEWYSNEDRFVHEELPEGEVKPVVWIVVAIEHYDGLPSHVTLLSEELIGRHPFDDSDERLGRTGYTGTSSWLDSGTTDAEYGLRPFLNSLPKDEGYSYAEAGFYNAFSESFKNAVLTTTIDHITRVDSEGNWDAENPWRQYTSEEKVFVFSLGEYGIQMPDEVPYTGAVVPYFDPEHPSYPEDGYEAWIRDMKKAYLGEDEDILYWTRTPSPSPFHHSVAMASTSDGESSSTASGSMGVRPAVNLSSDMRVSETPNEDGVYEIVSR